MRYLGVVKKENGALIVPDTFYVKEGEYYEAIEVGGDIILVPSALDRARVNKIKKLTEESIRTHRESLKNLA